MAAAKTNFTKHTGLAWDLYDTLVHSTNSKEIVVLPVRCPYCCALNDNIPLIGGEWSHANICGWIDVPEHTQGWRCYECEKIFTKDNLAAKKWKDEVTKFLEDGVRIP